MCYKILHRLIIESCSGKGLSHKYFFSQTLWASKTKKHLPILKPLSHLVPAILMRHFWIFQMKPGQKKIGRFFFHGEFMAYHLQGFVENTINTMGLLTYLRGYHPVRMASWFQWTTKHHLVTGSITARSPAARTPVATTRAGAGHRGRRPWMMPWRPTRWVDGSEAEKGSLEKAG